MLLLSACLKHFIRNPTTNNERAWRQTTVHDKTLRATSNTEGLHCSFVMLWNRVISGHLTTICKSKSGLTSGPGMLIKGSISEVHQHYSNRHLGSGAKARPRDLGMVGETFYHWVHLQPLYFNLRQVSLSYQAALELSLQLRKALALNFRVSWLSLVRITGLCHQAWLRTSKENSILLYSVVLGNTFKIISKVSKDISFTLRNENKPPFGLIWPQLNPNLNFSLLSCFFHLPVVCGYWTAYSTAWMLLRCLTIPMSVCFSHGTLPCIYQAAQTHVTSKG